MLFTRRMVLFFLLVTIIILFRYTMIADYMTLQSVKEHRAWLTACIQSHYLASVVSYIALYVVAIIFLLPVATVMAVVGGLLFGGISGALYATIGVTVGSTCSFLLMRYLFADVTRAAYGEKIQKFDRAFERSGTFYLLIIHLVAVIPLSLINMLAAVTRASLWDFVWTTALGVLPIATIYAYAGDHLGSIETMADIFSPTVLGALAGIAVLALGAVCIHRRLELVVA